MKLKKWISILGVFVFFYGCSSVPRNDTEIHGNAGYLKGTPSETETVQVDERQTRMMIAGEGSADNPLGALWQGIKDADEWIKKKLW